MRARENTAVRYPVLDAIRGVALLNMMVYHAVWDMVYLFGFDWPWYHSTAAFFWQQSICWTFILLAGFCWSLGSTRGRCRRGLTVLAAGCLVSLVTAIAMPEASVRFGVLTLLGSCVLLLIPLERLWRNCSPWLELLLSAALFALTRNVNSGYLGVWRLPAGLYANVMTAYLGFPPPGFYSTDYFALFPWTFLFIAGHFIYRILAERQLLAKLPPSRWGMAEWLGRHSLPVYLLHQPVIYAALCLIL